jgi:hypothetical protein
MRISKSNVFRHPTFLWQWGYNPSLPHTIKRFIKLFWFPISVECARSTTVDSLGKKMNQLSQTIHPISLSSPCSTLMMESRVLMISSQHLKKFLQGFHVSSPSSPMSSSSPRYHPFHICQHLFKDYLQQISRFYSRWNDYHFYWSLLLSTQASLLFD